SGEKGVLRFVMAPSSQEWEPPGNPARFIQTTASPLATMPAGLLMFTLHRQTKPLADAATR
ncbi:hypothetical protein, partial [Methylorubrum extorquens]